MLKSFTVSTLIFLFVSLIETAILSNLTFLPAVPDIVLLCSLYFSLINGRAYGEAGGFISGLIFDFLSGSPFGFNCLWRTLEGYAAGLFESTVNYSGILMPCIIGFSGTIVKAFLVWLVSLFYPTLILPYHIFSIVFISELALNTILAPLIFKILNCFKRQISIRPEENL